MPCWEVVTSSGFLKNKIQKNSNYKLTAQICFFIMCAVISRTLQKTLYFGSLKGLLLRRHHHLLHQSSISKCFWNSDSLLPSDSVFARDDQKQKQKRLFKVVFGFQKSTSIFEFLRVSNTVFDFFSFYCFPIGKRADGKNKNVIFFCWWGDDRTHFLMCEHQLPIMQINFSDFICKSAAIKDILN